MNDQHLNTKQKDVTSMLMSLEERCNLYLAAVDALDPNHKRSIQDVRARRAFANAIAFHPEKLGLALAVANALTDQTRKALAAPSPKTWCLNFDALSERVGDTEAARLGAGLAGFEHVANGGDKNVWSNAVLVAAVRNDIDMEAVQKALLRTG